MPNWCECELILRGSLEDVKKARNDVIDEEREQIDFNRAVPMPVGLVDTTSPCSSEEAEANTAKYGSSNWYDWSIANWGVKWTHLELTHHGWNVESEDQESQWFCDFESPWSAPEVWLKRIAAQHRNVIFSLAYHEPGMNFEGCLAMKGAEVLRDVTDEIATANHGALHGRLGYTD